MTLWKWSETAASNSNADSTVNWAEGQAPSSVNDSARAMMAAIAKYREDLSGSIVTGGSSTAYTVTTNQGLTALTDGFTVYAQIHTTSGASPTLNVDSLGAVAIRVATSTAVPTGALVAGSLHKFTYDSGDSCWYVNGYMLVPAANDLGAIEALTGTGIPKRTGSDTWAMGALVTDLANTTADRLFGTNGSGVSGLITLSTPLTLSGGALSVDAASDTVAGKIEIATQAEMVTGTDTGRAVVPGRQKHHPAHPKAWACIDQGAATISESSGISSITDAALGNTVYNLTTAFAAATYGYGTGVAELGGGDGAATHIRWSSASSSVKTTTALGMLSRRWDGGTFANSYDASDVTVAFYGAQ